MFRTHNPNTACLTTERSGAVFSFARAALTARLLPAFALVLAAALTLTLTPLPANASGSGMAAAQDSEESVVPDWLRRWIDPSQRDGQQPPRHIVIGLDLSKSNPLVVDNDFALKVGEYVGAEIESLPPRSRITLRTFGADSASANRLRRDRRITNANDASDAARFFRILIGGVPRLIQNGTIEAQDFTNIVSFMRNMSQVVDCQTFETTVILATDGLEDSEIVRLRNPGTSLPRPSGGLFEGCAELLILGVGQGQGSPTITRRLQSEWRTWASRAGFVAFRGLNNW